MKRIKKILAVLLTVAMLTSSLTSGMLVSAASDESMKDQSEKAYETPEQLGALARQLAADGMVLLKNEDNTLPIQGKDKVAVFGRMQIDTLRGGLGAAFIETPYYEINVLDGLKNAGVSLDEELAETYTSWCADPANRREEAIWSNDTHWPEMPLTEAQVKASKDRGANKAVVVIGRIAGENHDMTTDKGSYLLTDDETEMLRKVTGQFDNVAVVMNIGSGMDTKFVSELGVESLLHMGLAGQEGGNAVADILTGQVVPSAKLVDTFAENYSDYPSAGIFGGSNTQNYTEDIFVGYRYFEQFDPTYEKVNYEFGFGLSYTDFEISDAKAAVNGDNIDVIATVTNTGSEYAGKEVVQVYFKSPQMGEGDAKLSKPGKELAAFVKTAVIEPGESETVNLSFPIADMASYDDTGKSGTEHAWVLEAGDYDLFVGNSVKDAGTRKAGAYTQNAYEVLEECTPSRTMLEERLLADGTKEQLPVVAQPGEHKIADGVANKIEMENYLDKGDKITIKDFGDGSCIENVRSGQSITYKLKVARGGKYNLKLRYANGNGTELNLAKMTEIWVDSAALPLQGITLQTTSPGYYTFVDSEDITVGLPTGECVLKFVSKDNAFVNLDYITLERQNIPDPVFDIRAGQPSKVEMEGYYEASGGIRSEAFTDDGSGNAGECLAYMHAAGRYTSYKLNVESAGAYTLKFRYASANAAISLKDMASLSINNITIPEAAMQGVNFDTTSSGSNRYYNFKNSEPMQVNLAAGENILKIESRTVGFANLDYLLFEKVETTPVRERGMSVEDQGVVSVVADNEDDTILFPDVYKDPALMGAFIDQLSINDLAYLSGGQGNIAPGANTGTIGNLSSFEIPGVQTADGPMGLRIGGGMKCTAWPASYLLGATWDVELAEEFGVALGAEAKSFKVDCMLSPSINIHRDPLGGRNFEYFSEDPLLTGRMGAAVTNGTQSQGVSVMMKHYAVNSSEYNRLSSNSNVSERAMREIYLKNFEIAIKESQPWSIMSAYNSVNGTKICEDYNLMTEIPRDEWGFEGIFATDWGNNSNHVREAIAGNDVKMPSGSPSSLVEAVNSGVLTCDMLERNVEKILNMIMHTNAMTRADSGSGIVHTVARYGATKIKATSYAKCSGAIGAESCEDIDGGQNPTHTNLGEYLSYDLDVAAADTYQLNVRRAGTTPGASFDVYLDRVKVASFVNTPATGGWQSWVTGTVGNIDIPAGKHTLKMVFTETGMNVNWFELIPQKQQVVIENVTNISGDKDTTFDFPIILSKFPAGDQYKSIEGVVQLPAGVTVSNATANIQLSDVKFDYHVDAANKLRFAFISTGATPITMADVTKILNLELKLTEEKTAGETMFVSFEQFVVKSSDASVPYDVTDTKATIQIAEKSVSAFAKELYISDGSDVIPAGKKAVAVDFTGIDSTYAVTRDGVVFYYNAERSGSGNPTFVALIDAAVSLESLSDAKTYTLAENGAADERELRFGDSNDDKKINAQDALNTVQAWLRKGGAPTDKQILAINVNADGHIDTSDAVSIVDYITGGVAFKVASI